MPVPWSDGLDVSGGEQVFVFVLSATHGMQHFFGRIFPPLIPILATDLTLPLWKLGLIVTIWSAANGLCQAPIGHLSDRYDRRFILPTGVLVVGLGYLVVAAARPVGAALPAVRVLGVEWSGTLLAITLGMAVAGIGRAATHPTGYPLLSANVADRNKGTALGRWGSASKLGDAAGPAFVAVAILVTSWEGVFTIIAGFAVLYAAALFTYMTRSTLRTAPVENGDPADTADGFWIPIALVLLAFIAASFASRGIATYLPTFITEVYGFSFAVAGVTVGPESVASMYYSVLLLAGAAAMAWVGALIDRHDPRAILIALYLAATVALALLAFIPLSPVTLLVVAVLIGATLFAKNPARDAILTQAAPDDREGRVFGYFWTVFLLTTAAFPTVIGYLGDTLGIRESFLYLGLGPLLGVVPLLVLYRRSRADG